MTTRQKVLRWIAQHLPKSICYWVLIRCGTAPGMIKHNEEVPAVPFTVVLERWSKALKENQR